VVSIRELARGDGHARVTGALGDGLQRRRAFFAAPKALRDTTADIATSPRRFFSAVFSFAASEVFGEIVDRKCGLNEQVVDFASASKQHSA
jgi:hypothetical protein